eukprot:15463917-Alexandrium_andersonii.AAC.1
MAGDAPFAAPRATRCGPARRAWACPGAARNDQRFSAPVAQRSTRNRGALRGAHGARSGLAKRTTRRRWGTKARARLSLIHI